MLQSTGGTWENFFTTYRSATYDEFLLTDKNCRVWAINYLWMRMSSEILIGWNQLQSAIESEKINEPLELLYRVFQNYPPKITREDTLRFFEIFVVKYPIQLTQAL